MRRPRAGGGEERLGAVHVEQRHVEARLEDLDGLRVAWVLPGHQPDAARVQALVDDVGGVQRVERGQDLREVVLRQGGGSARGSASQRESRTVARSSRSASLSARTS